MQAIKRTIKQIPNEEFPVPKPPTVSYTNRTIPWLSNLSFQGDEHAEVNGMIMGSLLSPVIAYLFMEMLGKQHFEGVIGPDTVTLRNIDDIYSSAKRKELEKKLAPLDVLEPSIQLTIQLENDGKLLVSGRRYSEVWWWSKIRDIQKAHQLWGSHTFVSQHTVTE